MKKLLVTLMCVVMIVALMPAVAFAGTTHQITTGADLINLLNGTTLAEGDVIELANDVEVSEMAFILTPGVTVNGNGHTITAASDFHMALHGQINLVKIEADNVTLKDVSIVTTNLTKHALDVYDSEGVVLENVTLNHKVATKGAPLVNNSSEIVIKGDFTVVTGDTSWYAINLDNKIGEANIEFAEDSTLNFDDQSTQGDKFFVLVDSSNTQVATPTVESKSDNIKFEAVGTGNNVFMPHEHSLKGVEAVAATCEKDGTIAYWYCEDENCAMYFKDANGTQAVDKDDIVVKALGHKYADGKCTVCKAADPNAKAPAKPEPPKTGDAGMMPWLAVMAVAVAGVAIYRRKEN